MSTVKSGVRCQRQTEVRQINGMYIVRRAIGHARLHNIKREELPERTASAGRQTGSGVMNVKKIIGLVAFFIAVGMLLMVIVNNRFIGLIMIALFLFVGYFCFTDCR